MYLHCSCDAGQTADSCSVTMMYWVLFSMLRFTAGLTTGSQGCGGDLPPIPQPGEAERLEVSVSDPQQGEVTREFYLHLPAQYQVTNTQPVPLLLDYHWWGGSASSQLSDYPWPLLADTDSTPFIYLALQVRSCHSLHIQFCNRCNIGYSFTVQIIKAFRCY